MIRTAMHRSHADKQALDELGLKLVFLSGLGFRVAESPIPLIRENTHPKYDLRISRVHFLIKNERLACKSCALQRHLSLGVCLTVPTAM